MLLGKFKLMEKEYVTLKIQNKLVRRCYLNFLNLCKLKCYNEKSILSIK